MSDTIVQATPAPTMHVAHMAGVDAQQPSRSRPRLRRLRRGWVYRDLGGRGWWIDDAVSTNAAHRVVAPGDPSALYRVFTPMIAARATARRVYRFRPEDDHGVSLRAVEAQFDAAADDLA